MKLYIEPSLRKLSKIVSEPGFKDATLLHYTGNMFGIGARLSAYDSIDRINSLKARSEKAGMIVLVPDFEWFANYDVHIPARLRPLLEQYFPGNLSVVWAVDNPVTHHLAYMGKVAFRIPGDPLLRALLSEMGEPIVSTSVNRGGLQPETELKRIKELYSNWFDYGIVPHRRHIDPNHEPSTLVEYISSSEAGNVTGTDELKCLREGSIPFYEIKSAFTKPMILFVCTGNICRSPIAEKLFNFYAQQAELDYKADSCGIIEGGSNMSLNSLQLLLKQGITEAQDHVSKKYTSQMLSASRLILTMEERQKEYLIAKEPGMSHKIMTLNEITGEDGDIVDPYGSDLDNYKTTYDIIDDRLKKLISMIRNNKIPTV